jgi:hypothetical protein
MQISGVSLALTWPCSLCLLRFLLCVSLCYKLSTFQALGKVTLHPRAQACVFIYSSCGRWVFPHLLCAVLLPLPLSQTFLLLITGRCCCSCQPPCLCTAHMGSGYSLLSCGVFLPPPLTRFPAPGCWACSPAPARASPACPACLFTVLGRIPFPQSSVLGAPHLLSLVSLSFLLLITQFLFFPRVEVRLSRELCCSGPRLSVGIPQYYKDHLVHVFPSRLDAGDWRPGGPLGFSV